MNPIELLERATLERDFLFARAKAAGSCSFSGERWTGLSSNALVEVAFGGKNDWLPMDGGDLAACYRTVMRLPEHLRTDAVLAQLATGEAGLSAESVAWARESSGWICDSGSGPQGGDGTAPGEAPQSGRSDSAGIAQPTPSENINGK